MYSEELGSKGYSKLGEPLTSVNAQKFGNVRTGLKQSARGGMGGEEAQAADRLYSAMANTKKLIDNNSEAVNKLKQRITERGTLEKLARGTVRILDTLSGGTLRGAAQAVFPSNMGLKVNNFMQLEENLAKNLDLLNNASKAKTESQFIKILNNLKFPGDAAVDDIGKRVDDFKALPSTVKQGGYIANPLKGNGAIPENSLISEAKKYKSAEEFVKAQPKLFHGGTADIKDVNLGKSNFQKTFYMSDNADYAKSYGGNKSVLNEMTLSPQAKMADLRNPTPSLVKEVEAIISSKPTGKMVSIKRPDGSILEIPEVKGGMQNPVHDTRDIIKGIKEGKAYFAELPEVKQSLKKLDYDGMITQESKYGANYGVWNKDVLKTKSQLTDIWKKANQRKSVK